MRLDCPHCGSRLRVEPPERDGDGPIVVEPRLHGDEYRCRTCENELDIYVY